MEMHRHNRYTHRDGNEDGENQKLDII